MHDLKSFIKVSEKKRNGIQDARQESFLSLLYSEKILDEANEDIITDNACCFYMMFTNTNLFLKVQLFYT